MIEFWFGRGATGVDALVMSSMVVTGLVVMVVYWWRLGWR